MDVDAALVAADAAVRARDPGAALAALLEAWQVVRAPELATLIDTVSPIAAAGRLPITGGSQRALHAAWMDVEKAGDPADIDRLLDELTTGKLGHTEERIARLSRRPPDPRVAARLEALLEAPPSVAFVKGSSVPMWNAVCAELSRIADPRTRTIADRLAWLAHDRAPSPFDAGTKRSRTVKAVAAVAQAIAPAAPLSDEARERCVALAEALAPLAARSDGGAEMLAQIYADPRDLSLRAVYADYLSEQGDPRGELIVLQLARAPGEPPSTRERTLLRTHQSRWVGPLGAALRYVAFERGFVAVGHHTPDVDLSVLAVPEAATLEDLHVTTDRFDDGRVLAAPPFHGLRRISGLGWQATAGLLTAPAPTIREIRVVDVAALPPDSRAFDADLALDELELDTGWQSGAPSDEAVRAFVASRIVRRLRRLHVGNRARNDPAFVAGFLDSEIGTMSFGLFTFAATLAVTREGGQPRTRIACESYGHRANFGPMLGSLQQCAAGWPGDRIGPVELALDPTYDDDPEARTAVIEAARALGTELTIVKPPARKRRRRRR